MTVFKSAKASFVNGYSSDPVLSNRFSVYWGGRIRGGFSRISGLKSDTDVFEVDEITDPITPRKLFGVTKFSNVTLEHGVVFDLSMLSWRNQLINSSFSLGTNVLKKDIRIEIYGRDPSVGGFEPSLVFELFDAWPVSLAYGEFNAMQSALLVESVEFAFEGMEITSPIAIS